MEVTERVMESSSEDELESGEEEVEQVLSLETLGGRSRGLSHAELSALSPEPQALKSRALRKTAELQALNPELQALKSRALRKTADPQDFTLNPWPRSLNPGAS